MLYGESAISKIICADKFRKYLTSKTLQKIQILSTFI